MAREPQVPEVIENVYSAALVRLLAGFVAQVN